MWLALAAVQIAASPHVFAADAKVTVTVATGGTPAETAMKSALDLPVRLTSALTPEEILDQAQTDRDRLNALLLAQGHYEGQTITLVNGRPLEELQVDELAELLRSDGPVRITFAPIVGPLYTIGAAAVIDAQSGADLSDSPAAAAAIAGLVGQPATADRLQTLEREVLTALREAGHAAAAVAVRDAFPDPASHRLDVTFAIDLGAPATLGAVSFEGLHQVDPEYLAGYVPFAPGDPYRPDRIERLRSTLERLPFFRSVRVDVAQAPDASGMLPVTVHVTERPPEPQRLRLSGMIGAVTLTLAAAALGAATLLSAGNSPVWQRYGTRVNAGIVGLVVASALMALQRILELAMA